MSSSRDHRRQLYERLVGQPVAQGRFVITDLLGFGGMGAVYEAVQQNMDRKVALKLIPTHDPTTVARFEREALTISKLRHPNTITVFDFGQSENGFLFLSMELLSGRTLTDEIQDGPMTAQRAVHIASQICRSLAEAHRSGIVHRDVKPDNIILIQVDDDPDVVKVLDFGIAKAVMGEDDVQLTGDGRIIGTPRYMSPEQILAEPLDHRSDIYSLGCILFEMLCGAPPFQQTSTTALMISHTQDPPPPFAQQLDTGMLARLPAGLERVVRRALAKDPADRPANCDRFREELEQALRDLHPTDDGGRTLNAPPNHDHAREHTDSANQHVRLDTGNAPQERQFDVARATPSGRSTQIEPRAANGTDSRPLIAAIGALVVVIIAMIAYSTTRNDGEPPRETEVVTLTPPPAAPEQNGATDKAEAATTGVEIAAAPTEEPETPKPGFVTIHIESDPPEANVYQGKSLIGPTPVDIPVKAELNKHDYRLVKEGHEELNISIHVNPEKRVQAHTYRLRPRAVAEKPSPKRRPSSNPQAKQPRESEKPSPEKRDEATESPVPNKPTIELLDDGPKAKVDRLD